MHAELVDQAEQRHVLPLEGEGELPAQAGARPPDEARARQRRGEVLLVVLERRLGSLHSGMVGASVLRTVSATAVMAEVMVILSMVLRAAGVDIHSLGGSLLLTVGGGIGGFFAFAFACALLNSEEYRMLLARLGY